MDVNHGDYARATTSTTSKFNDLPSEVIQQILYYLPPTSLAAIAQACKRLKAIGEEPLLWRYNCRAHFNHWRSQHDIADKLARPVAEVDWRHIFAERWSISRRTSDLLNEIVGTQKQRIEKLEAVAEAGYDAKDKLLELANTGDDAEDWLAKRWWSEAALGLVHRKMAIDVWTRVAKGDSGVRLESALGAFDVFTLGTRKGDFEDITARLDELAAGLREKQPDIDGWPIRRKALALVAFLRSRGYTGVTDTAEHYHDIQNNFIGYALHDEGHQTLPLILTSIFICLAERFGIDAYASNVPMHIFGLVKAPLGETLDGGRADVGGRQDQMFIDPFRHSNEVPEADVRRHLLDIGVTDDQFEDYTTVATTQDLIIRTTRNIMTSAQTSRERDLAEWQADASIGASWATYTPLLDESLYAALWALLIVQTLPTDIAPPLQAAHLAARRARMLPLLLDNMQTNCPWDVCLLEETVLPMFMHGAEVDSVTGAIFIGHHRGVRRMSADREQLVDLLRTIRVEDSMKKPQQSRPKPPPSEMQLQEGREDPRSWGGWLGQRMGWESLPGAGMPEKVQYRVGSLFRHKRYGYEGMIVGWDTKCEKDEGWISQMGVNGLSGGRDQSFYHVLAADKSARYVAEENIEPTTEPPSKALMMLAGRYFKRWDSESGRFISNMREEYPDD